MIALWTSGAAVAATGGRTGGTWCAHGVSIDTRRLAPGDLFVALPGHRTDGHAFLDAAFAAGAAAAVVRPQPSSDPRYLEVSEPLQALQGLGRSARARTDATVVAVTGSVGKTGTKELLRAALSPLGPVHASASSYNNAIGVPLSLARMPCATAAAVFEIGMNRPREIGTLVELVRPDIALVTRIAPAHLEYFGSLDRIAAAKAEIFEGLKPGGNCCHPARYAGWSSTRVRGPAVRSRTDHHVRHMCRSGCPPPGSNPDGCRSDPPLVVRGPGKLVSAPAVGRALGAECGRRSQRGERPWRFSRRCRLAHGSRGTSRGTRSAPRRPREKTVAPG